MIAVATLARGEVTFALNRGFWLNIAESNVDPERGSPVMKWKLWLLTTRPLRTGSHRVEG